MFKLPGVRYCSTLQWLRLGASNTKECTIKALYMTEAWAACCCRSRASAFLVQSRSHLHCSKATDLQIITQILTPPEQDGV